MSNDIYDDLEDFDKEIELQNIKLENKLLKEKNTELENSVTLQKQEIEKLKKLTTSLKFNISKLFKTAKAEIERKDEYIDRLKRKNDNIVFRRNNGYIQNNHEAEFNNKNFKYDGDNYKNDFVNIDQELKIPIETLSTARYEESENNIDNRDIMKYERNDLYNRLSKRKYNTIETERNDQELKIPKETLSTARYEESENNIDNRDIMKYERNDLYNRLSKRKYNTIETERNDQELKIPKETLSTARYEESENNIDSRDNMKCERSESHNRSTKHKYDTIEADRNDDYNRYEQSRDRFSRNKQYSYRSNSPHSSYRLKELKNDYSKSRSKSPQIKSNKKYITDNSKYIRNRSRSSDKQYDKSKLNDYNKYKHSRSRSKSPRDSNKYKRKGDTKRMKLNKIESNVMQSSEDIDRKNTLKIEDIKYYSKKENMMKSKSNAEQINVNAKEENTVSKLIDVKNDNLNKKEKNIISVITVITKEKEVGQTLKKLKNSIERNQNLPKNTTKVSLKDYYQRKNSVCEEIKSKNCDKELELNYNINKSNETKINDIDNTKVHKNINFDMSELCDNKELINKKEDLLVNHNNSELINSENINNFNKESKSEVIEIDNIPEQKQNCITNSETDNIPEQKQNCITNSETIIKPVITQFSNYCKEIINENKIRIVKRRKIF